MDIHIIAKPIGSICNLNCKYCYYLDKKALYQQERSWQMNDEMLEAFIQEYITAQSSSQVEFVWHGGEPTLLGLDFFKKAIKLQHQYTNGKTITNSLQTNGSLLTDEWCKFLKKHSFLVGISLDGPEEIHDRYRTNTNDRGSFDETMRGLKLLQKHKVDFNILACVAKKTAKYPLEVYTFFKNTGAQFIQFTPIVERIPTAEEKQQGQQTSSPTQCDNNENITSWTVDSEAYGNFLIEIFEEWVRNDVGTIFVMNFEWALNAWVGNPSPVCQFAEQCGKSLVMEYNGDIYACDHCVFPEYKLGNILTDNLTAMVDRSLRTGFGVNKTESLPTCCNDCEVLAACHGGCPNYRFLKTTNGEQNLSYLCIGHKKFLKYIRKYLKAMTQLLENGLPVSRIMDVVKGPLVIKR